MGMSNACLDCKHRGTVPNSRHSSCKHQAVQNMGCVALGNVINQLADRDTIIGIHGLAVEFDERGIEGNWALWPFCFDPIWLVQCTGYEEVD